ncbi:unnamed protein product, partial [Amoebophrya sp. A25]
PDLSHSNFDPIRGTEAMDLKTKNLLTMRLLQNVVARPGGIATGGRKENSGYCFALRKEFAQTCVPLKSQAECNG